MRKLLLALIGGAFLFATIPAAEASKDQTKAEKVSKQKKQSKKAEQKK